jgi:SNF2 family DNA or RNA helicase
MKVIPGLKGTLLLCGDIAKNFVLLGGVPGRTKWIGRSLAFQPVGVCIAYVLEHWPDAEWEGEAVKVRDHYIAVRMQESNTIEAKKEILVDESGYQHETNPFNHQAQAFVMSRDLEAFGLFHEQGTGKTKVFTDTAAYLWEHKKIDALIVVAPNGIHYNWIDEEIPKHIPKRIPHHCFCYSSGHRPKTLQAMLEASKSIYHGLLIFSFNLEGFVSQKAKTLIESILRHKRCLMIIDESQGIKNPTAVRTKYLTKIGRFAQYRRIGTGTPLTKGVEHLYSQFKFLDPMILGHNTMTTFKAQFCIMGGFEERQIVAYKNIQELMRMVSGYSHRVTKAECLDLPEKIYQRYQFDLSDEQRKVYDAVRKGAIKELTSIYGIDKAEELKKEIALVNILRLRQIACGRNPDGTTIHGPDPRFEALGTILGNLQSEKAIIWACFREDLLKIIHALGNEAVSYWGGTSKNDRESAVKRFQEDPRIKYFIGNPSTAGAGLTLTAAETSIYYCNDRSLLKRLQSEDRNHRIGTKHSILYIDIEARCTVESKIIKAFQKQKDFADQFNQDPLSAFMEGNEYE